MNKLTEVFTPSRVSRGNRHIVKGQIVQGDKFEVEIEDGIFLRGIRRAFWSNPDSTHSCHMWRMLKGVSVDRITVDSWEGETLNEFAQRTETILLGGSK